MVPPGSYGSRRDTAVEAALHKHGITLVRTGSPYAVAPGGSTSRRRFLDTGLADYHEQRDRHTLQAAKVDPAGDYLCRWIPELRNIAGPAVHQPWRQRLERTQRTGGEIDTQPPLTVLRSAGVTRTRQEGTRCFVRLRREDLDERFPGVLSSILAAAEPPTEQSQPAGRASG